ncbi:MAG: adenine-specific DNA-methyltransferase [Thermoanaerobaculia bacterium]|jgi:hypothetical protein|nr:adenine-specific DNA-methyltransferase [Thermoanaerobaculia bacterium]
MADTCFEKPLQNSPHEYPKSHWELDEHGQPANALIERRRPEQFITPIPKAKKRKRLISGPDNITCWLIDTDYNEESFFVRQAYLLGANDPYGALKTTLKAEINKEAWSTLHSAISRPFAKPAIGRIAVKVINHLGDEVMKVFRVN